MDADQPSAACGRNQSIEPQIDTDGHRSKKDGALRRIRVHQCPSVAILFSKLKICATREEIKRL
jgi:hypothetical protein